MANENKPLVEVKPGDPITAGRFNGMQKSLRQEHIQHAHTGAWKDGLFDGAPIGTDGLADGAVTGAKIAATAALSVRSLAAESAALTGALRVDADATVGGALRVGGEATLAGLKVDRDTALAGSLKVGGEATLAALKVTGELGVEGAATLAALRVSGTSTLSNVVLGSLAASGGISTPMLGVSGDLNYQGKLGKLDVAESGAAILRCSELMLGHSTRRGEPGRALVDFKSGDRTQLVLNFGRDWSEVEVQSSLTVRGMFWASGAMLGGKFAVVSEGPQVRVVWGVVDANCNIVVGAGFTVERHDDGTYLTIKFAENFNGTPCVVAQQLGTGNTRDNTLVDWLKPDSFIVMNGDSGGDRRWRPFCFIAIGQI